MPNVNLNVRMDSELKNQFEEFCDEVGMSMSTAFIIYAKKVVAEWRIPFTIGQDIPNAETRAAIKEVEAMEKDPTLGKTYHDVDEMMKDILSEEEA